MWWLGLSALLLAAQGLAEAPGKDTTAVTQPDYTLYNTREQLFRKVFDVVDKHPLFMEVDEVPLAVDDYEAILTVVTVEPGGLSRDHDDKMRLLISFGEHGRELITPEVGLRLLELLGQLGSEMEHTTEALTPQQKLLRRTVFKILPMENVNGRKLVESGQLCERKNGRGVDPNRNWDAHWGFKEPDYDPAEEYPGSAPFSEPETALLLALTNSFRQHVWLNMHSGMEALFMPYDHLADIPPGPGAQASLHILQQLNTLHCGGRCAVGSGGKSVGYLAHGTATDYMYDVAGVPMSFTWEIFGDLNATFVDCFKMFNPVDSAVVEATISNWAAAVVSLVELLPNHPDIAAMNFEPSSKVAGTASNQTALAVTRIITESEQPSDTVSAGAEAMTHDSEVHGGTNHAVLQHTDAGLDSEPQHNVLVEHGHVYTNKLPAILNWLYVLPVVILVLLVVLLKSARKGRTSWLRMRQRVV
ncbi:hypothetical protein ABBQ38_012581 [Trebouxia sp. C0009 RCD-2024]